MRCEYLFDGYGNGLDMFALPEQLPELAPDYAARTASWYGDDPVLAMLGTDHSAPPEDLAEVIRDYDAGGREPHLSIATLDGHLARYATDAAALSALPQVHGEMRSHARGNLLPGVFSIRTNLKREMARSEQALTAAERLDLMYGTRDHRSFFDTAWYRIVESTAHDSVTGCGVDATAEQVGTRIHTAGHIARGVIDTVLRDVSAAVSPAQHLVFNPSGFTRRAQVEVTLHGVDAGALSAGVQLLDPLTTVLGDERMRTADLPKILRRIHGRELFGQQINGYEWGERSLRFQVAESPQGVWDLATFTVELEERVAADAAGDDVWHVETIADPRHRALLAVDVDGLALAAVGETTAPASADPVTVTSGSAFEPGADRDSERRTAPSASIGADGSSIDGALALSDDGDCGDSYNYGPVDAASAVSTPSSVEVTVLEEVRCAAASASAGSTTCRSAWTRIVSGRSTATVPLVTETTIELREGEGFLRVGIDYVNTASTTGSGCWCRSTARDSTPLAAPGSTAWSTVRGTRGRGRLGRSSRFRRTRRQLRRRGLDGGAGAEAFRVRAEYRRRTSGCSRGHAVAVGRDDERERASAATSRPASRSPPPVRSIWASPCTPTWRSSSARTMRPRCAPPISSGMTRWWSGVRARPTVRCPRPRSPSG